MRDGKNRDPGLAFFGPKQALYVQRFAFQPGRETRRREHAVDSHRQLLALGCRVEGLQIHDAYARERRF